jgi:hypothetical protein
MAVVMKETQTTNVAGHGIFVGGSVYQGDTGLFCPFSGLSYQPPEDAAVQIAFRVITLKVMAF